MLLRPHHLLCMSFFQGKGYSAKFVANMAQIIDVLKQNPDTLVTLVCRQDCLCEHCPHNIHGLCSFNQKILHYDQAVLKICGFNAQETYRFKYLSETVKHKIITPKKRREVCSECTWSNLCS